MHTLFLRQPGHDSERSSMSREILKHDRTYRMSRLRKRH